MSSKEIFLKTKELKLTEVENVLTMLREMVPRTDRLLKAEYLKLIGDLEQDLQSLRAELAELRTTGDSGWKDLGDRIEVSWGKLRTEVESVICQFEGETE